MLKFVDSEPAFSEALQAIRSAPWAAVDTEADSLHHYAEKLSLLQVTVGADDFVIDPLAPLPIQKMMDELSSKHLYFHAADSDVRLMKKAYTFSPRNMFDTMIAAQLLGYPKIGLADLAEKHCGIRLSKAEQKADWSERPLSEKLISYAANDTHYLKTIADAMDAELQTLGRKEWHRQQCARLLETLELIKAVEDESEAAWQIKGAKHLKGKALTILKELWHWRDALARERDRPPFKVMNSEYLIQMAEWVAEHPGMDVIEWSRAPRHVKGEHRETLNKVLAQAQHKPQAVLELPTRKFPRTKWTEKETKLLGDLKTVKDRLGAELKIHPSLIATNAVLESLAEKKPKNREDLLKVIGLLPWQVDLAGEDFLKVLAA